jgi:membrane protease YdiL (CAAX protease family)
MFGIYLDIPKPQAGELLIIAILYLIFNIKIARKWIYKKIIKATECLEEKGRYPIKEFFETKIKTLIQPFEFKIYPNMIIFTIEAVILISTPSILVNYIPIQSDEQTSIFLALTIIFLGPIFEEILFRGLIFGVIGFKIINKITRLEETVQQIPPNRENIIGENIIGIIGQLKEKNKPGLVVAIIVIIAQAFLFAIVHIEKTQFYAFLGGIIYGAVYFINWVIYKQKSLAPSIIAHMTDNLLIFIVPIFLKFS